MKNFLLGGRRSFRFLLITVFVMAGSTFCTTKFKTSEDGEEDAPEDTQTDEEGVDAVDGIDGLDTADGQDVLEDIIEDVGEEEPPEPSFRLAMSGPHLLTLNEGFQLTCDWGDSDSRANLRVLENADKLIVATSYQTIESDIETDCIQLNGWDFNFFGEEGYGNARHTPPPKIYGRESLASGIAQTAGNVYVFQVVDDCSGDPTGDECYGNVKVVRFRKPNFVSPETAYVFEDPWSVGNVDDRPPRFRDLHVHACEDLYHVIVKVGTDSPIVPGDYFGFTLHNDPFNNELDNLFDTGYSWGWDRTAHFIQQADEISTLMFTDATCHDHRLVLAGQFFEAGESSEFSIKSMILKFNNDLIRADSPDFTLYEIHSHEDPMSEFIVEGLPSVLGTEIDVWPFSEMLFVSWISNRTPFTFPYPSLDEPNFVQVGRTEGESDISYEFISDGIDQEIWSPEFDCGVYSPMQYNMLYDEAHGILHVASFFYDFAEENIVLSIYSFDANLNLLIDPIFEVIPFRIMLSFDSAIDSSGNLYFVWFDYDPVGVVLPIQPDGYINVFVDTISVLKFTYVEI